MAMPVWGWMAIMLVTGTANTILMKFQDLQMVPVAPGASPTGFDYPFFQTLLMMLGELLCLGLFFVTSSSTSKTAKELAAASPSAPAWVFLVPCLCDWTATTLVNGAYIFVAASVVQMTRGAIVIFTCIFSSVFLGKRQSKAQLFGVFLVFLGITTVSLSAFMTKRLDNAGSHVGFGIALCVGAQLFQASMLVYEEKVMKGAEYDVQPLQMVGMEGLWGVVVGIVLLAGLNATGLESTRDAVTQMQHSGPLCASIVASIFSIAFFNWSGVTVTQQVSAVSRSTVDCSRTILVWGMELALHWHAFSSLQLLGFVILAFGTLTYNGIITLPLSFLYTDSEEARLVKKNKDFAQKGAPVV